MYIEVLFPRHFMEKPPSGWKGIPTSYGVRSGERILPSTFALLEPDEEGCPLDGPPGKYFFLSTGAI
jgi:hypothetical protein